MVMKKDTSAKPRRPDVVRPRRLSVAEAKAKLSEALRSVRSGPSIIHNRGRDVAVLIDVEQYEQLIKDQQAAPDRSPAKAFLDRLVQIKQRFGGGVDGFEPPRTDYRPRTPFSNRQR
jgi:prevent-host-death family protein